LAAALSVIGAAEPGAADGAVDIGWSVMAGADVAAAPVGAVVVRVPLQPAMTTAVKTAAVSVNERDFTGDLLGS